MPKQRQARSRKGATLIEFACAWSVGWLVLLGLVQAGSAIYTYQQALHAVQIAAKAAAEQPYDLSSRGAEAIATIQSHPAFRDVPGLKPQDVQVSYEVDAQNVPHRVTVSLEQLQTGSPFSLSAIATRPSATQPFLGPIQCSGC